MPKCKMNGNIISLKAGAFDESLLKYNALKVFDRASVNDYNAIICTYI